MSTFPAVSSRGRAVCRTVAMAVTILSPMQYGKLILYQHFTALLLRRPKILQLNHGLFWLDLHSPVKETTIQYHPLTCGKIDFV
jgi:hypothetical protein